MSKDKPDKPDKPNKRDKPSRLDDSSYYDSTTILEHDGITVEVLDSDLAYYKMLGYTVVGPGQPRQKTSFTDKKKVAAFNSIKRFHREKPIKH